MLAYILMTLLKASALLEFNNMYKILLGEYSLHIFKRTWTTKAHPYKASKYKVKVFFFPSNKICLK